MYKFYLKRLFDIVFSLSILVLLFPLLIIISMVIAVIDGLPVLFLQERVGRFGKEFHLIKFRSMKTDSSEIENTFPQENILRLTRLGSFLRKYKIDEIPQFLNVLMGDISIVGPRPEISFWVESFPEEFDKILKIRPGITDYASIKYSNEEYLLNQAEDSMKHYKEVILPSKLSLNICYVNNHSFFLDIKIIVKTIFSVMQESK